MKSRIFLLLCALSMLAMSCTDSEQTATESGDVQFSLSSSISQARENSDDDLYAVLITVKRADGSIVYNREKLLLYKFGSDFISEPASFFTGDYQLTEFFVLDENEEVIYASPSQGSKLAYLVQRPLPIDFTIAKDTTIKVTPEVLAVDSYEPGDFGYSTFSFDVVLTFNFSVAVFTYNDPTKNFELTTASILVTSGDSITYQGTLDAVTNYPRLRDGLDSYTLRVSKAGYATYLKTFTAEELKSYTGENILKIILLPGSDNAHNGALAFDGSYDFVDLGDIYNEVELPLTVSAWVWVNNANQLYYPIITSQDLDAIYNGFYFVVTYSHIGITYGDGQGENNYMYRRSKSALHNNVVFGKWVHIAAVMRSATDMEIYMDGVNIGGEYAGGSNLPMASNFPAPARIGSIYSNGIIEHYNGLMDELNVWDRALSPEEIAELRLKKLSGNEAGLIGYWNFDETEGQTVFDLSPYGYNGLLGGNVSRVVSGVPELH